LSGRISKISLMGIPSLFSLISSSRNDHMYSTFILETFFIFITTFLLVSFKHAAEVDLMSFEFQVGEVEDTYNIYSLDERVLGMLYL
jgi:hypothetical protein